MLNLWGKEFVTYRVLDVYNHDFLDSPGASESQSDRPAEQAELGPYCAMVQLFWVLVQSLRTTGVDTKFVYKFGFGWQQHVRIVLIVLIHSFLLSVMFSNNV